MEVTTHLRQTIKYFLHCEDMGKLWWNFEVNLRGRKFKDVENEVIIL